MAPRVVLVGLPGAGKSTTGRRLAKILAVGFADSDELVEASAGRSVRDIFASDGEAAFRAVECAAVSAALSSFDGVLSLGGGALTHPPTRTAVVDSAVTVAFLHAPLAALVARVGDGRSRPLLSDGPAERLAALERERSPLYESVATLRIDTDGRTPGQVAASIAARLHEMGALT